MEENLRQPFQNPNKWGETSTSLPKTPINGGKHPPAFAETPINGGKPPPAFAGTSEETGVVSSRLRCVGGCSLWPTSPWGHQAGGWRTRVGDGLWQRVWVGGPAGVAPGAVGAQRGWRRSRGMTPSPLSAGSPFPPCPGRGRWVTQPPRRYETSGQGGFGQRARRLTQRRGHEPPPASMAPSAHCPFRDGARRRRRRKGGWGAEGRWLCVGLGPTVLRAAAGIS